MTLLCIPGPCRSAHLCYGWGAAEGYPQRTATHGSGAGPPGATAFKTEKAKSKWRKKNSPWSGAEVLH